MNEVENIFSIPVYTGEVNNKEKLNDALLNSSIIKENKLKIYEGFTGDFVNSFKLREDLNENWVDDLLAEIIMGTATYVKSITKKGAPLPNRVELLDVWFNSYEKGQYQEPHQHLGPGYDSLFSFVYYLKLPKDSTSTGATIFVNDGYDKVAHLYLEFLNVVTPHFIPKVDEGNYIIFPSFLTHYVKHHTSEHEKRITIAGNIHLLYDQPK